MRIGCRMNIKYLRIFTSMIFCLGLCCLNSCKKNDESDISDKSALKIQKYKRWEMYYPKPKTCHAPLEYFVFDISHFFSCGVFPNFHVINEIFRSGGSEDKMALGASWKPFSLTLAEYEILKVKVLNAEGKDVLQYSRYFEKFVIADEAFDSIEDRFVFIQKSCDKYINEWQSENKTQN